MANLHGYIVAAANIETVDFKGLHLSRVQLKIDSSCLRDLARHFKTDPTEIGAYCFGYPTT
jgi:hypothetical protein